jgi:uncharacterized membrane protein
MATPIIMLVLMTAPYLLTRALVPGPSAPRRLNAAAAIGLGLLFLFTASGHFVMTEPMALMLPPWIPARTLLVHLTGLLELTIAVGFLVPRTRRRAGWIGAAVLVLFFPANVYAALNQVPMGAHAWGPVYLLIRAPLQLAILVWIWWFIIRAPFEQGATKAPSAVHT